MTTRAVVDGIPNDPIAHADLLAFIAPILEALGGLDAKHVVSLSVSLTEVRAKVAVVDKRGRRLNRSWAHVARGVDFPKEADK